LGSRRRTKLDSGVCLGRRTRSRSWTVPLGPVYFNDVFSTTARGVNFNDMVLARTHWLIGSALDLLNLVASRISNMLDSELPLLVHLFDVNHVLQNVLSCMLYFQNLMSCVAIVPVATLL
jgi:hypothetical protein